MELLPSIVIFIVVALCLVGAFSLISFIYFRLKKRRSLLAEEFSPNDNINEPYLEMTPLNIHRPKDALFKEEMLPKNSLRNINLSNIKNSKNTSFSISVPQFNNSKTLHTTAQQIEEPEERYQYISRIVNYNINGLQLYSNEVSCIRPTKVFRHLKWETQFITTETVQHHVYTAKQGNLQDLLDIFKLQPGIFKAVKFTVVVTLKNSECNKNYFLDDLAKTEKVESISENEYKKLASEFIKQ